MRQTQELELTSMDYTEEDLIDTAEWPRFSNIRIIKMARVSLSESARQEQQRLEKIHELETLLESSDAQLAIIKDTLKVAQLNHDKEALQEALTAYSEHLEYVKKLEIRLRILKEPIILISSLPA